MVGFFKYILEDESGFTSYDKYFEYIKSNKEYFGSALYDFASDVGRYDLKTPGSLHDLKFKCLAVDTTKNVNSCELSLLGDGYSIAIRYTNVRDYLFSSHEFIYPSRLQVLCHEITISDDNLFVHAIEFDRELFFKITFSGFEYVENVRATTDS